MNQYIVCVIADDQNRIVAVNSSAFLPSRDGWTEIDSGNGDKYYHAQGNYFAKPLMDERGIWRYKLECGKAVERSQEEMDADYVSPAVQPTQEERIKVLEDENKHLKEALELLLSGATEEDDANG